MLNTKENLGYAICMVVLSISIIGCSNLSPNPWQREATLENLDCYEAFIREIVSDSAFSKKMIKIRDSKKKGRPDPVTVQQAYRLIAPAEFLGDLSTEWQASCWEKLSKKDDFRGIRYIDQNFVIIEVDEIDRYTLTEQYAKERTREFHRLIIGDKPFERSHFYFGNEFKWISDTLGNNWIYEVSQMKMAY